MLPRYGVILRDCRQMHDWDMSACRLGYGGVQRAKRWGMRKWYADVLLFDEGREGKGVVLDACNATL